MSPQGTLAGRYIAVGAMMAPAVILLGAGAEALLGDRERVAGRDAALRATFGNLCEYAFQCTAAMLCYLIEHAQRDGLPHGPELAAIAAAIVTGRPIGNGRDYSDGPGGVPAKLVPTRPRKPAPAGTVFSGGGVAVAS